jgi:hypothetical protein
MFSVAELIHAYLCLSSSLSGVAQAKPEVAVKADDFVPSRLPKFSSVSVQFSISFYMVFLRFWYGFSIFYVCFYTGFRTFSKIFHHIFINKRR